MHSIPPAGGKIINADDFRFWELALELPDKVTADESRTAGY